MKSGNLNFLEPSGPLQAYNVTALPFLGDLELSFHSSFEINTTALGELSGGCYGPLPGR